MFIFSEDSPAGKLQSGHMMMMMDDDFSVQSEALGVCLCFMCLFF